MQTQTKNLFKKVILSSFLILAIMSSSVKKAEAVCPWCYNIPQGIIALVQQTGSSVASGMTSGSTGISAGNSISMYMKEYVLDKAVVIAANKALGNIKGEMAKYLKEGGFNGAPSFIQDPEQFFTNIAKDQEILIKKELLGTEGSNLFAQNKDIFKLLSEGVKDDGAAFEKSITSTIGSTICSKLGADLQKAIALNENTTAISSLRSSYAASCTAGDKRTQYQNQKECAKNYSCGGFDSILAITQNLGKNTDSGKYEATLARYQKEVSKKTDVVNKELDRGDGFLNKKECVKFTKVEGREVCEKYQTKSPGITSASILDQLIREPVQKKLEVKTINDAINSLADSFFSKIIDFGISEMGSVVSSSDTGSTAPSGTGTGGPPKPDPMQLIEGNDLDVYLDGYGTMIQAKEKENRDSKVYVDKELGVYINLMNSYDQVALCYKDKVELPINKNRPGALTYPAVIPQDIKDRASQINSNILSLKDLSTGSALISKNIDDLFEIMKVTNHINVLEYYRKKIEAEQKKPQSLKKVEWTVRDSKNDTEPSSDYPSLFGSLRKEAVLTLRNEITTGFGDALSTVDISPLARCNNDPRFIEPVVGGGGI